MPETIRVGIIGAGKIAQDRHIPLLQKVPDVRITHAWSRRPETARQAARRFGIPHQVERWEQIVESPEIDAVVVATPPNLHLPATLAALDAGKHVLCQARMARNLKEARRMLEASTTTDRVTALYAAGFGLKGDRVMRRRLHREELCWRDPGGSCHLSASGPARGRHLVDRSGGGGRQHHDARNSGGGGLSLDRAFRGGHGRHRRGPAGRAAVVVHRCRNAGRGHRQLPSLLSSHSRTGKLGGDLRNPRCTGLQAADRKAGGAGRGRGAGRHDRGQRPGCTP